MVQPFVNAPKPTPLKWHGFDTLYNIMSHYTTVLEAVFYEVLDIPLRELEQLKTLKASARPSSGTPGQSNTVAVLQHMFVTL